MLTRNRFFTLFLVSLFVFAVAACDGGGTGGCDTGSSSSSSTTSSSSTSSTTSSSTSSTSSSTSSTSTSSTSSSGGVDGNAQITLNGNAISVSGTGATAGGTVATITSAGTYTVSGTLDNGQIVVDTESTEAVEIILDGVDIHNPSSSPIYINNAEDVIIVLAEGSENRLSDGSSYVFTEGDEPDATLFSKEDLTITGRGTLTIDANFNNAIKSKDKLTIEDGIIEVDSVDDAIIGKDHITVKGGIITVNAAGDGLKSTEGDDPEKGYIKIKGGQLDITAGADGLQAESTITIAGGSGTITTGGGSNGNIGSNDSAKGLKASVGVNIEGGDFTINSADDAINTNDNVVISGGTLVISSGDDGIHGDNLVSISGGETTITKSYEGIESLSIAISGGTTKVTSSDDGVNAVDPNSSGGGGWPGGMGDGNATLAISGGYLYLNANGDGLDSNGSITMTDGVVIVDGPTASNNGPLDHAGFRMTGGFLVAVGSSRMAQAPSNTSTQYALLLNFTSVQQAGRLIHIQNSSGNDILTFAPAKNYQSLAFSSPELTLGSTYSVYLGGSSTGTVEDGLYTGGTYSSGSEYTSFTISQIITTIGSGGMRPGGF